ncbi:MAG: diaminopimelate epimerase [Candidatus Hydrogenedentota bacterium]
MRFHKMQGAGNDYVYIDTAEESVGDPAQLAILLSDRNFGIGGDGIILIESSTQADARMRMFNADGSESEMCGNGIRCVAKYLFDRGRIGESARIETGAGMIGVQIAVVDGVGKAERIRVDMGRPRLVPADVPTTLRMDHGNDSAPVVGVPLDAAGSTLKVTCVSMGNPHCVIFVPDVAAVDLPAIGPRIEHHPAFPRRTNVEFVQQTGPSSFRQRTWERGSGVTLACGTGASAVCVAATLNGLTDRKAQITLDGGVLDIEWGSDDRVSMTGPAGYVFSGEVDPARVTVFDRILRR